MRKQHLSRVMHMTPPQIAEIHCLCDKFYHKQELRFLLYLLGQIVTWQYYPNPLD